MDPQELQQILSQLEQMVNSGQKLPPELQQIYDAAVDKGMIKPQGMVAPDKRAMAAAALRSRPKDFRPVPRNEAGGFDPAMNPGGMGFDTAAGGMTQGPPQMQSAQYGGTLASGAEGVPPSTLSPDDLMMHYAEQMALKEAGQPISDTMVSQGRRVTAPADTEVRPWAQRTPAGYKDAGKDPSKAPLQPVARQRNSPLTFRDAGSIDDEAVLRQLMGL